MEPTTASAIRCVDPGARNRRPATPAVFLVAPEKPSQTPNAMFAGHMMLEHVEGRARTTCNQARKKAIQRSSHRR
ncbi:hypothetical protein, partial [Xanthomonas oryzae]